MPKATKKRKDVNSPKQLRGRKTGIPATYCITPKPSGNTNGQTGLAPCAAEGNKGRNQPKPTPISIILPNFTDVKSNGTLKKEPSDHSQTTHLT